MNPRHTACMCTQCSVQCLHCRMSRFSFQHTCWSESSHTASVSRKSFRLTSFSFKKHQLYTFHYNFSIFKHLEWVTNMKNDARCICFSSKALKLFCRQNPWFFTNWLLFWHIYRTKSMLKDGSVSSSSSTATFPVSLHRLARSVQWDKRTTVCFGLSWHDRSYETSSFKTHSTFLHVIKTFPQIVFIPYPLYQISFSNICITNVLQQTKKL